jgi:transglutaminase-like putative cysteine protease
MNRTLLVVLAGALGCFGVGGLRAQPSPPAAKEKTRSFQFTYAGQVTDLKPGTSARVWLPLAVSNGQQDVAVTAQQIQGEVRITKDKRYGNSILYFQSQANGKGEIPFAVTYKVKRKEVKTDVGPAPGEKLDRYLQPDAKVPIAGKPLELLQESLKGHELPKSQFAAAKMLYDVVNKHMTYKKVGAGWGQGDSLWACDSRYGNCSDFHSLFISMARGSKIAAKFEMGFPLPAKTGAGVVPGYHCWAWFLPAGKGWVPVDISEANQHPELSNYYFGNLSANRVGFSVGRDIDLEPRQQGPPLNFFIYPYVEVDGKALPADKVVRRFSYKDLP